MDGIRQEALFPELMVSELCLLSGTLFHIGLQGQALGWSLASLVVACRQLWLSQARVPNVDKAALLDSPISPGHTFGPAVEEIPKHSHRECEASRQVAALLPPRALTLGTSSHWQSPQALTITRMVPVPTAPLGDLRHRLQSTMAAGNRTLPQGRGNAGHGTSTQQGSKSCRTLGQAPLEHLKDKLEDYMARFPKVKIVRTKKREGLIRTRLLGATVAKGEVLTFLDSHCEANVNWLPPLLDQIAQNHRTIVCPMIDVIDHNHFGYEAQAGDAMRGAFDWEMYYKRIPIPAELQSTDPSDPFE
ncbi:UNVERIFIED_CONTAM: hypothetical protein FKN15_055774 [Acipenser sinensis]